MSAVERHYDAAPQQSKRQRLASPTLQLRRANNFVKEQLYDQFGPPNGGLHVEFACGKGGDLFKLKRKLGPRGRLIAIDISQHSIDEARRRLLEAGPADMPHCFFYRADMTDPLLYQTLTGTMGKDAPQPGTIDSVSCHFALHYAWDTETRAKQVFANAALLLKKHGQFTCTIVDWPRLMQRMSGKMRIENALFSITMPNASMAPETDAFVPRPYTFQLVDAVLDCEEYGILPEKLCALAEACGFAVAKKAMKFSYFLPEDASFWRQMTQAERDVYTLYAAWVFVKK